MLMARPPNPNPNKEPPGMFTIGVRRNGATDTDGKRSISEEDYIAQLQINNAEYVFDLRSGRGATDCKQNTIKFPGNGNATKLCGNPSKPNFMCECKIEEVHKSAGIGYEWAGKPVSKTGEDSYTGTNLGGSRVSLAFNDYKGKPGSNWGTIRRAKYNKKNLTGCNCPEKEGGKNTLFEIFDPIMHAALQRIFEMAKEKRVVLLCVEDELHKCHKMDWVKFYVKEGFGKVVAIEPKTEEHTTPGSGWSKYVIDQSNVEQARGELQILSAARRPPDKKKTKVKK